MSAAASPSHNNSALDRRQLVRPTSHIPWSVDVIRAVPKKVVGILPQVVASCTASGWAAVTTGDGYVYVWQHRTVPLSDLALEPPEHCLKVFVPDLIQGDGPIHLALATSSDNQPADAVNLFAWNQGWLLLRKLTIRDLQTRVPLPRSHTTKIRVADLEEEEAVASLQAGPNMLILTTTLGNLYWVTVTPVPVGLHIQKIIPPTGWLSRVVFGSPNSSTPTPCPAKIVPLNALEFVSMAQEGGSISQWKVTVTTGTAHHASFDLVFRGSLIFPSDQQIQDPVVLQTALAPDQQSIHAVIRGKTEGNPDVKLFWIQLLLDGTVVRTLWLSRFPEPHQVQVQGMSTAENGTAYASFSQNSGVVMVMALLPGNDVLQEVDLPNTHVPSLLPDMMEACTVTHGSTLLAGSGIGIRVRHLPNDSPPAKKARFATSTVNQPSIQTMVAHLRSSFWQAYQDPEMHRPLPPSLKQAEDEDLEQAVLTFATELQHKGDVSSAQNPMEWHRSLVTFLQQRGLYRRVSQRIRWQLLSVGQELAVFGHITQAHSDFSCQSHDMADWLLQLQEQDAQGQDWKALLSGLLDAAMLYREESANPFYDVVADQPTEAIWLSHASMQLLLLRQLEEWKRHSSNSERSHVASVVKAALQSYSESIPSKEVYAKVQSLAIGLLRSTNRSESADTDDELAFDLCIQHNYFEGLCQISVDHEKSRDAKSYSLDPLFTTIQGTDLLSGFSFSQFVLQWHTDRALYGHAINYGRHSPADLTLIMNQDERLRKYRWIPAIRQSYFDQATESCLANCEVDHQLSSSRWALSMAKLANKLAAKQSTERQDLIDQKLELVQAQQMLQDDQDPPNDNVPVRPPGELVQMAVQRLQGAFTRENQVRFALIGLAVCSSMTDKAAAADRAARVWAEILQLNAPQWTEWIQTETDLASDDLRERILAQTVFGTMLEECRQDTSLSLVTYGRHLESAVLGKLGGKDQLEFSRLLRSISMTGESISAKTLVVAKY